MEYENVLISFQKKGGPFSISHQYTAGNETTLESDMYNVFKNSRKVMGFDAYSLGSDYDLRLNALNYVANELKQDYPKYLDTEIYNQINFNSIKNEEIKTNSVHDDYIQSLQDGPSIKDLSRDPLLKDLYNAYAKDVLADNGNIWSDKTNQRIGEKMLKNGVESSRVVASLKYSPEKVDKPYNFIKTIENKPEVRSLQKSRGMEFA